MPSTPNPSRRWTPGSVIDGRTAIVLAALLWSTIGLAKSFLPPGTGPLGVAAARVLASGVVFACGYARPAAAARLLRPRRRWPVAVAAVAMAAYQALYFCAMQLAGVAVGVMLCVGSIPVFGGAIALLTRSGRPSRRWMLATALAVSACAVLAGDRSGPAGHTTAAGIACGLGAGCAYAVFTAASCTAIRRGGNSRTTMALTLLGAGLMLGPLLLPGGAGTGWLVTVRGSLVIAYVVLVATVVSYLLYGRGLETTAPATASTLVLVEPAGAALIGIVLLGEHTTVRCIAGLGLLAAALAILTVRRRRRPSAVPHGVPGRVGPRQPSHPAQPAGSALTNR